MSEQCGVLWRMREQAVESPDMPQPPAAFPRTPVSAFDGELKQDVSLGPTCDVESSGGVLWAMLERYIHPVDSPPLPTMAPLGKIPLESTKACIKSSLKAASNDGSGGGVLWATSQPTAAAGLSLATASRTINHYDKPLKEASKPSMDTFSTAKLPTVSRRRTHFGDFM